MAQRRQILTGIRHGYTGYTVKGCGCDICRAAFREYMQEYRQRRRDKEANPEKYAQQNDDREPDPAPEPGTWVDDVDEPHYDEDELPDDFGDEDEDSKPPKDKPAKSLEEAAQQYFSSLPPGPVLLGVNEDLHERNVDESAPGLAALARRLAQIVDNPMALPQAPSAAARLLDVYKQIGVQIKPRGSKLAAVREMIAKPGGSDGDSDEESEQAS